MSDLTPITREEALLDGADLEPITRKEQFIKRIYDKTQEVPEPITREEWFLKKAGEGTSPVTIEQLNATENGTYSESGKAYSPVIVEVPAPTLITKTITENGTYNASEDNADGYSQVTVNVPYMEKKSASGDIASFSDGAGYPFLKVKANINPVQDLHGYDYPWVGGAGKNKFDIEGWFNSTGATYTKIGNSYYLGTQLALLTQPYQFSDTDIAISVSLGAFIPDAGANPQLQLLDSAGNVVYQMRTSSSYQKYENIVASKIRLFWPNDGGGKFTLNEPQIEFGSTASPFTPYSNICPISGFTGVNVTVSPTTTEGSGTVYPISWQDEAGIVYGGYIDLVSGVLTVTTASASLGARTWSIGETPSLGAYFYCSVLNLGIKKQKPYDQAYSNICSQYRVAGRTTSTFVDGSLCFDGNATTVLEVQIKDSRYTDATAFKTMLQETNAQLVYELATPQTYQLTPQQINTLIGQNNAWNNTNGQTEVEYFIPIE